MTKKLDMTLSLASNTIGSPTGYGMQGQLLAERLLKHGAKVANLSNYGLEGNISTLKFGKHEIPHYPRGFALYSEDVLGLWHQHHLAQAPNKKNAIIGLYDVWVWNNMQYDGKFFAWVPLDHITLPPAVAAFLRKPNVTAIAMSPHGVRQLAENGIASFYIPHSVDTSVYKPTPTIEGKPGKEYIGIQPDDFLVGMVAANKANGGFFHRKAFAENLLAFSIFAKDKPDVKLYLHTEPSAVYGGFNLPMLLQSVGIELDRVIFPDPVLHRIGYPPEVISGLYTAFDVFLSVSYGEGFGVPTIEAQACGSPVITSNFAASQDLASEDSWKVNGQPFWDEKQAAFFMIPQVKEIVDALEAAYSRPRGKSEKAVEFAKQFDADKVFEEGWLKFLTEAFA
jgi:glycosyltransferase involved in cell wall biosynthesis